MSADNWRVCPKCEKRILDERKKRESKIKAMYGKIPEDKYRKKMNGFLKPQKIEESFREDYDICTEDSILYISYSGRCENCGFNFRYDNDMNILK